MFLKLSYGKSSKKVVFRPEFKEFDGFMKFIEYVTKKDRSEIYVSTVDKEGEKVPISDQYELDYFIEQTRNDPMSTALIEYQFGTESQAQLSESRLETFNGDWEAKVKDFFSKLPNLKPVQSIIDAVGQLDVPPTDFKKKSEAGVLTSPELISAADGKPFQNQGLTDSGGKSPKRKRSLKIFDSPKKETVVERKASNTKSDQNDANQQSQNASKQSIDNTVSAPKLTPPAPPAPVPLVTVPKPEAKKPEAEGPKYVKDPILGFEIKVVDQPETLNKVETNTAAEEANKRFEANLKRRLDVLEANSDQLNKGFLEASGKDLSATEIKRTTTAIISISHSGVSCDQCGASNIVGRRYKCLVCDNFDLCEGCESMNSHLHPMVRLISGDPDRLIDELNKKFIKLMSNFGKKSSRCNLGMQDKLNLLERLIPNDKPTQSRLIQKYFNLSFDEFSRRVKTEIGK